VSRTAVPPPVTMVMEAAGAWLPRRMSEVESRLTDVVASGGDRLRADASATLEAGGKRLRPILVLLCAGPGAGDGATRAAAAVELVHMATLVHDDVLDAAPLRRGRPTVFSESGRERATAVGDLLLSRAFGELAVTADPDADAAAAGAERAASERQVALLADASVALAMGELAQRRDAFDVALDAERYLDRCLLKTARLFECACVIGRPGDEGANDVLARFGTEVGLAFQLLDDVLDVSGPPERTGKARGTDLLDGTVTLPLIWAREEDDSLAEVDLRALDAGTAEALCDRIAATRALDRVRSEARRRVEAAKELIAAAELRNGQRELMRLVADGVVERYA
jgi:geranylgeranyl pyrophosphate synthase